MRWLRIFLVSTVLAFALVAPIGADSKHATASADKAQAHQIDINSASVDELKAISGIGDAYANRIIAGRPYKNKAQLKSRGILPEGVYEKVKDSLTAKQKK